MVYAGSSQGFAQQTPPTPTPAVDLPDSREKIPAAPPALPAALPAALLAAPAVIANYDEATGKRTLSYPPHRVVDYKHMLLEITIPDMNQPRATAIQTLTIAPLSGSCATLSLNAKALKIKSVSVANRATTFVQNGKHLTITFDPPLVEGHDAKITTTYQIDDPPLGLTWTPESPDWPGRPAQLHSQGQPETNSYWFPCHDFPNEKLTTELIITAPAGFTACSNGRLVEKGKAIVPLDTTEGGGGERTLRGYESWHFLQDKPHVNYLVSLVVGKFDVVDLGTTALPLPVYVPPGRGGDVKGTYGRTGAMIAHFEKVLGVKYPWDKYAQLVVWNFGAGGMENTSATTLYDTAVMGKEDLDDFDLDGLISHELAHQWFGNLLTCNSWEHIWLNEGFATYLTALWFEKRDGFAGYQQSIRGNMDGILSGDKPEAPTQVGMVSKVYTHPWETFRRAANPYGKGASIIHMLRARLGDPVFFKGVHNFVEKYKFATVETNDLRNELEAVSGQSLELFFTQWCLRPGAPKVTITPVWDEAAKTLTVAIEQTQAINGDNPAFEFDLPLYVQTAGESAANVKNGSSPSPSAAASPAAGVHREVVSITGKSTTATFPLESEPTMFSVDPDQAILADYTIEQPVERWLAQLASGPTPAAKVQAIRALGKAKGNDQHLRRVVLDPKQFVWLRVEAVRALAERKTESPLRSIASESVDSWEVREAIMAALPSTVMDEKGEPTRGVSQTAKLLADRASRDSSLKVRCAAVRSLGKIKSDEHKAVITQALTTPSQSDSLRQAALDALIEFNQPEMLAMAVNCTRPGLDSRTRPAACGAVAKLSRHDPELAYKTLVGLLRDREFRTARAAGEGLVTINDPRAIGEIEKVLAETRAEEVAWQAGQWLKSLKKAAAAPTPPATPTTAGP